MQDFRTINDFRKGYRYSNMAEDPTYLSFFLMFDYYTEESPLFNGTAVNYLRNVLQDEDRAQSLEKFIKVLKRVNSELPWFWQELKGLEVTRSYDDFSEPWWGAKTPAIEITCLETVELTTSGMMDLYRKAAYDFDRWVEVLPRNIRRFRVWVWVSEVRDFGQSSAQRLSNAAAQLSGNEGLNVLGNDNSVKNVRPFFKIELGYCEWDLESTSTIFADLSRNPDSPAQPSIKFFWQNTTYEGEYANNAIKDDRKLGQMIADVAKEKAAGVVSGAIDRTVDSVVAQALLGNVHGLNLASSLQDAVSAGSINGIANLIGGAKPSAPPAQSGDLGQAYDPTQVKVSGPINDNIYGNTPIDSDELKSENVYTGSVVNDSETLGSENVYDSSPSDSEGPINQNVHK